MEICIDSIESAKNAISGGASRLEVCSALSEGGLTPSSGLVFQIRKLSPIPIYIMIRVRAGNFVYSEEEMNAMIFDIETLKKLNPNGFVFGALTNENEIHNEYCEKILNAAQPFPVTFHRAFDYVKDPLESLEIICKLGFERILTSGQKESALVGISLIQQLIEKSKKRIIIMPGAGITKDNLREIKNLSKTHEFHASAKKIKNYSKQLNNIKIGDGVNFSIMIADENLVREMVKILKES
ncbi:copper homeostasis protein cutC homolog [Leptopilina boulardi]|uniref:copper homeostasis protein cutC homolog n=1 Tax=Leptopilina boulardi TaxID=63433 RepID=UPI0021F65C87|nr:copper homeostasis protein cutC homolog [Leptopilina boulardi]